MAGKRNRGKNQEQRDTKRTAKHKEQTSSPSDPRVQSAGKGSIKLKIIDHTRWQPPPPADNGTHSDVELELHPDSDDLSSLGDEELQAIEDEITWMRDNETPFNAATEEAIRRNVRFVQIVDLSNPVTTESTTQPTRLAEVLREVDNLRRKIDQRPAFEAFAHKLENS